MAEIIALEQAKAYLGIEHSDDDSRLIAICARVSADIQRFTRRSFSEVTAGAIFLADGGAEALILPGLPVAAVTKIEDLADGAAEEDLDLIEIEAGAGLIFWRESGVRKLWPGWYRDRRYRVTYSHGYASAPEDVKGAAYDMIAARYERPDSSETSRRENDLSVTYGDVWASVEASLRPYRNRIL